MINEDQLRHYPLTEEALGFILKNYFLYRKTYQFILENFDLDYLESSEELLSILKRKNSTEIEWAKGLKALIKYSHEYLILQAKLEKQGKYLFDSYDEINEVVYQHERMDEYYLDGLFLSQIFWPNHYKMGQFFIACSEAATPSSAVLDVPSGTGVYSYYLARHFDFDELISIDISPYANKYTDQILDISGCASRSITTKTGNILTLEDARRYDLIVCGELLEHLKEPQALLEKLYQLLVDQGKLFLTTAIYAAAIDHLYLFECVDEVRRMIDGYFEIENELVLPITLEEYRSEMHKVPINYACVLRRLNR